MIQLLVICIFSAQASFLDFASSLLNKFERAEDQIQSMNPNLSPRCEQNCSDQKYKFITPIKYEYDSYKSKNCQYPKHNKYKLRGNRNYLEKQFEQYRNKELFEYVNDRNELEENRIDKACIQISQQNFFFSPDRFIKCEGENKSKLVKNNFSPCLTQEYVNLVYNLFTDISDCLNVNPTLLYSMLAHESGFHIPIKGPSTDSGIAMMMPYTYPGIKDFADNNFNSMHTDKKSCARLTDLNNKLPAPSTQSNFTCAMTQLPYSPGRGLLASAMFIKRSEKEFDQKFSTHPIFAGHPIRLRTAREQFVLLSYNSGSEGAATKLKWFLESKMSSAPFAVHKWKKNSRNQIVAIKEKGTFMTYLDNVNPKSQGLSYVSLVHQKFYFNSQIYKAKYQDKGLKCGSLNPINYY